jgi:prevent-host-death family protein
MTATEFKAKALRCLDDAALHGQEFVITKHGKPVARLLPIEKVSHAPLFGSMKGLITITGDIVNFDTSDEWEVLQP